VDPNAPLRGISVTYGMAHTINGGPHTLPIEDPGNFGFDGGFSNLAELSDLTAQAYSAMHDVTNQAVRDTRLTISMLDKIDFANYKPSGGAVYTSDSVHFGQALRATAALLKADVGVEAAHLDFINWDTHANQGTIGGFLDQTMQTLAANLAAFYTDMFT